MTQTRNLFLTGGLLSSGVLLSLGMATASASASDVRTQLPPEIIAQHCIANGIGSNAEGRFMLPGGQRITGSVLCTEADMKAPTRRVGHHDDDDVHGFRHGGRHGHEHHDDEDHED